MQRGASADQLAPAAPPLVSVAAAPPSLIVGVEQGIFLQHGLDVQYPVMRSSAAVAATVSGQVNYLYSGDSGVLAAAQDMPLKLFVCNGKYQLHSFVAQPAIRDWPDLRGKSVAVSDVASTSTTVAEVMLARHSVPKSEVTFLPVGSTTNARTALLANQVEGAIMSPQDQVIAEQQGYRVMGTSENYVPLPPNCTVAHETKLSQHRDEVKALIRGTFDALKAIREQRDATIQTMVSTLELEPGLAAPLYDALRHTFETDGRMIDEQIAWQLGEARERVGSEVPPSKVYDWSVLDEVLAENGPR
jgi:ABC-type nitrate/sulfonate/bicarbonate transport system substrate-binding protein